MDEGDCYTCIKCENEFDNLFEFVEHKCKEQPKMTREEARKRVMVAGNASDPLTFVKSLEALGLLKFDEPKKAKFAPHTIFQLDNQDGRAEWYKFHTADNTNNLNALVQKHGTIRLEEWPEGLVLWVGGEIVWRSWYNQNAKYGEGK